MEIDINILNCPECRGKIEELNSVLQCMSCNKEYGISEGIPILLPVENTGDMDYIEHYKIDGEEFDYYNEDHPKVILQGGRRVHEYLLSEIPMNSDMILDIGSGNFWLAKAQLGKSNTLVSMDISLRNVSKGMSKYHSPNHFAVVGDALNPPFQSNTFDCIVAAEVIEHLTQPEIFIENMIGLLKPGGTLILSTPYKEKIPKSLCVHCNKVTPHNSHLHSFDENKLENLYNGKDIERTNFHIFGNWIMMKARLYVLLSIFPFALWKLVDKMANSLFSRPMHIIAEYKKRK